MNCEMEILTKFAEALKNNVDNMHFYESYGRTDYIDIEDYDNDEYPWPWKFFSCSFPLSKGKRMIVSFQDIEGQPLTISRAYVSHSGWQGWFKADVTIITETVVSEDGITETALKLGFKKWIEIRRKIEAEAQRLSCASRLEALS